MCSVDTMHYCIYLVLNTFPAPSEHFGVHVGTEVEVLTPKLVGVGGGLFLLSLKFVL